jgi:Ca2+-binding RTX toxin-like protein
MARRPRPRAVQKRPWNFSNGSEVNFAPDITPDGRFVVFVSKGNLDGNDDDSDEAVDDFANSTPDIFLQDFRGDGFGLTRVSVDSEGNLLGVIERTPFNPLTEPDIASSYSPAVSNDGRIVAFVTDGGVVPADQNAAPQDQNSLDPAFAVDRDAVSDVYVKDLVSRELVLITIDPVTNLAAGGVPLDRSPIDDDVALPTPGVLDLSGNGQSIVFSTFASLDQQNDTNELLDIYVADFRANAWQITLVSSDSTGQAVGVSPPSSPFLSIPSVSISNDGQFIAFATNARLDGDTDDDSDIFIWDRANASLGPRLLANSDGASNPKFSMDGRFVCFESIVPLIDDTNDVSDIYRVERENGQNIVRVSGDARNDDIGTFEFPGSFAASVSANGRFVAYHSPDPQVPGDANKTTDIYVRDLVSDRLTRANADDNGDPAEPSDRAEFSGSFDPALSADGTLVAFASDAPNLLTSSVFANGSDQDPALVSLVRGDSLVLADVVFDNFRVRSGDAANNRLRGSPRDDLIEGLDGHDRIAARGGADQAFGGDGNDRLNGGRKSDLLEGNGGRDRLDGSFGDDRLKGGDDDDLLLGGNGNDRLQGGMGNDVLRGGRHNDRLEGNAGDDRLYGDRGADQFVFDRLAAPVPNFDNGFTSSSVGQDRIFDFSHRDGDRIVLANFDLNGDGAVDTFADIAGRLTPSNRNTVIDLSDQFGNPRGTDTITVIGVTPTELQPSDFVFE